MAGFLDQVIGTALLILLIFALSDEKNIAPPPQIAPMLVGLVVVVIGMSFGASMVMRSIRRVTLDRDCLRCSPAFATTDSPMERISFWFRWSRRLIGGLAGGALYESIIGRILRERGE